MKSCYNTQLPDEETQVERDQTGQLASVRVRGGFCFQTGRTMGGGGGGF